MRKSVAAAIVTIVFSLLLTSNVLSQPVDISQFPPEVGCYTISEDGKPIGVEFYMLKVVENGWELSGWRMVVKDSVIKRMRHKAELEPIMRFISFTRADDEDSMFVSYEDGKVKFWRRSKNQADSIQAPEKLFILGKRNVAHWALITKLVKINKTEPQEFKVFSTDEMSVLTLTATPSQLSEVDGIPSKKVIFTIGAMVVNVWVDTSNARVYRIEIPSQKFVAKYTPQCPDTAQLKVKSLGKIVGEALKLKKLEGIKVEKSIKNPLSIRYLRAKVNIEVEGNLHYKLGWQRFKGKYANGRLTGEVEIETKEYRGRNSWKLEQLKDKPKVLTKYVRKTEAIPKDNELIKKIASQFDDLTIWEFAKHANRWVADHIGFDADISDVETALKAVKGNSLAKARILCAVLRAKGIPARVVGGLYFFDGVFMPHYWVELWAGPQPGWKPVDPSTGEDIGFSALHITLTEGASKIGAGQINIIRAK